MSEPIRECDICGQSYDPAEDSDRLCGLCLICESERISMGGSATPRYHRDKKVKVN